MRVTQKKIAEKIGVSISLVSRVLSGSAREIGVPQDTIREVEETARSMGYIPNRAAQALKGKSTRTIGVVVYDFKDPFFSDFVALLQEKLHSQGYSTILVGFTDRQIVERDLTPLRQHILDAVIILGSDFSDSIQKDLQIGPIFRIGHKKIGEPTISFCPDEVRSAQVLAEYFERTQCRKIRIVQSDIWNHYIRAEAMQKAFEQRGFEVKVHVSTVKSYFEAGVDYAANHLDLDNLPDVVVCIVDQIAIGVMRKLKERGIRIPEQVKITGFDDIQFSRQFYPALTTFSQPMAEVIDKIIARVETRDFRQGVEILECPLILRQSC
jgi:LacI family transcriptional regulator